MKHFLKTAAVAVCALVLCIALIGCNLMSVNEDRDKEQIAAKVGEYEITKGEVMDVVAEYVSYYAMFGYTLTEDDQNTIAPDVLEELIAEKVQLVKAKELGYAEFTDEDREEITKRVDEEMEYYMDYVRTEAEAELEENPDLDVEARALEIYADFMEENLGERMTYDEHKAKIQEEVELYYPSDKLYEDTIKQFTITDDDVRVEYDTRLAETKTLYEEDLGSYKSEQEGYEEYPDDAIPPLYSPSGYRRVRVIEIYPEGELSADYTDKIARMEELSNELGALTIDTTQEVDEETAAKITQTQEDYAALKTETDRMLEEFLAPSQADADAAYGKLEAGEDFAAVMLEYGMNDSFKNTAAFQEKGMLLSEAESTTDWPAAVKEAALALTEKGSYSAVLKDEDGFYIVQYVDDEPSKEVPYEDVKDLLYEEVLAAKQESEWNALLESWMSDETLVTRYLDVFAVG